MGTLPKVYFVIIQKMRMRKYGIQVEYLQLVYISLVNTKIFCFKFLLFLKIHVGNKSILYCDFETVLFSSLK